MKFSIFNSWIKRGLFVECRIKSTDMIVVRLNMSCNKILVRLHVFHNQQIGHKHQ